MKTNFILGLVTLLCAVGSAVASKALIPTSTWISGQTTATGNPTTCSTLGTICNTSTSSTICRVSVTLEDTSVKVTRGFDTNACTANLFTPAAAVPVNKPNLVNVINY